MADPTGIIDFVYHPPLGLLVTYPEALAFTEGNYTVDSVGGVSVALIRGLLVVAVDIGPGFGRYLGWDGDLAFFQPNDTYPDTLGQVVTIHTLLSGETVVTQTLDLKHPSELLLVQTAIPSAIGIHVPPGVTLSLFGLALPLD